MTEPPQIPPIPTPTAVNLIIYGDVNGSMQTVQATGGSGGNLAEGIVGGLDPGLAWLTGDFTGSGKTQIAEPWDSAFVLVNAPQPLALNIYGDVNGSVQAVQANVELGQGVGALAWLSGDFLGSGKTQIAQLWNNNDNLALIIYGDVNGSMQTVQAIGNLGQGPGALAWLTGDFTGSGKTQIAQLWNNNDNLALIIYGDVNGSMQTVRSNGNLGQGPGALAWLTGDFTGSGKTQIAQPWNNNGQLGLIIYGQVVSKASPTNSANADRLVHRQHRAGVRGAGLAHRRLHRLGQDPDRAALGQQRAAGADHLRRRQRQHADRPGHRQPRARARGVGLALRRLFWLGQDPDRAALGQLLQAGAEYLRRRQRQHAVRPGHQPRAGARGVGLAHRRLHRLGPDPDRAALGPNPLEPF